MVYIGSIPIYSLEDMTFAVTKMCRNRDRFRLWGRYARLAGHRMLCCISSVSYESPKQQFVDRYFSSAGVYILCTGKRLNFQTSRGQADFGLVCKSHNISPGILNNPFCYYKPDPFLTALTW